MYLKKNITLGKVKYFILLTIFFNFIPYLSNANENNLNENYAEIVILDKVSSKSSKIEVKIGKEIIFQNLSINILKCQNSKFDDDPEITAYLQVKDIMSKNKNAVFIFNDWTFASSPSIKPFDHPVYDIWLKKCFS